MTLSPELLAMIADAPASWNDPSKCVCGRTPCSYDPDFGCGVISLLAERTAKKRASK